LRKQLVKTVTDILKDERVVLLLGDIGVYSFREAFQSFPDRVFNIGILEQASVGLAAGLAMEGMIPVFHTIAPFLVERALEQLKVDFGYQKLNGNFISVGASYDYASLGCTHHCPGDVSALMNIPGFQIIVPGHPEEFDDAFRRNYDNGKPTYYRLSEQTNAEPRPGACGRLIKSGPDGTVIAIGPMLDKTIEACQDLNVSLWYDTNVSITMPYNDPILVVEPFYEGTIAHKFNGRRILSIGVPRQFLTNYGTRQTHDAWCGLTAERIRQRIKEFFNL